MTNKKESMLEAFLRQSQIDDKAADKRDETQKKLAEKMYNNSVKQLFTNKKSMRDSVEILTRLTEETVGEKAVPKPGEKGFTEIDRWKHIGGKTDDVEMGEI